jgi:hypothetical protein
VIQNSKKDSKQEEDELEFIEEEIHDGLGL